LPFLRFSRDKRGYELTCLMHAFRGRGQLRPRILYCFRTPPNVRVGRGPLDEAAIRAIEEHNQDVKFDWPRILQPSGTPAAPYPPDAGSPARPPGGPEGPPASAARRRPRRGERAARRRPEPAAAAVSGNLSFVGADAGGAPQTGGGEAGPAAGRASGGGADESGRRAREERAGETSPAMPPETAVAEDEEEGQAGGEGGDAAGWDDEGVVAGEDEGPAAPAESPGGGERPIARLLSADDIGRLRARFAEVAARLAERVPDAARLEDLRAQADRLNPDTWVTADEVRQALEDYERVYHSLREAIGPRGPGRRRKGGNRSAASTGG
jgi:hypothetical protein